MARAQLLIEGFSSKELLALARRSSLMPLFEGKPVAVTYGDATLLGGVRKKGSKLVVEVVVVEGAERALPPLKRLVRQIATLRGVRDIEWRLPKGY